MESRLSLDYLRLSITDLCNLNCIYCTPLKKADFLSHDQVLRYEEIARLVKILIEAGIRKVRITGGEPLIKKNVVELVSMLSGLKGLEELSMTTNGVLLKNYAKQLKDSGLGRINISIDTLNKTRFKKITGKDLFDEVWQGIESAIESGLSPVKLNVVPLRGFNEDEIIDFVRLTFSYPLIVRFIEFFHTNPRSQRMIDSLMPAEEVKKKIVCHFGGLFPASGIKGNGPAVNLSLTGAIGAIGFINGSTSSFCAHCNRIRVDCAGRIYPCLYSGYTYDTRLLLRNGSSDSKILNQITGILKSKPQFTKESNGNRAIEMSTVGG